jgi:hypothetical protein
VKEQLGLFTGRPVPPDPGPGGTGPFAAFRKAVRYRRAKDWKNCSNCLHGYQVRYHGKNYRKCRRQGDSRSEASDVSKFCVCIAWTEQTVGKGGEQ